MQDFIDQANKNGVTLIPEGNCQFCGATYEKGIIDCIEAYSNGLTQVDFQDPKYTVFRFLSVDAHALQHPEIHGRWSNHFHLTRLNLIIEKKQHWNYKKSPRLSDYLNQYKLGRPQELLVSPKPLQRGKLTSKNLTYVQTSDECIQLIEKWARQVYEAWYENHELVSNIAKGFLQSK